MLATKSGFKKQRKSTPKLLIKQKLTKHKTNIKLSLKPMLVAVFFKSKKNEKSIKIFIKQKMDL